MNNSTLETIHSLRTIHGDFTDQEINTDELHKILEASVCAANSSARQQYSIVVLTDREIMREVCQYAGAAALIYCIDNHRLTQLATSLGYRYEIDPVRQFVNACIDCILATQTAVIAAKSLGIDSLVTNGIHRGDISRLYRLLDLPKNGCFPLAAVVLGYPQNEPAVKKGRLCGPGIIHYGKYHSMSDNEIAEMIDQYDSPDTHLGLYENWKNDDFAHYLDWLFGYWCGYAKITDPLPSPTPSNSQIKTILQETGFLS